MFADYAALMVTRAAWPWVCLLALCGMDWYSQEKTHLR